MPSTTRSTAGTHLDATVAPKTAPLGGPGDPPRAGRSAPPALMVIRAIAAREIRLAAASKLVRLLFLFSVLPPLVFTVIIVARILAEQATGTRLGWDPLLQFLQFQSAPVLLLALGLGVPAVANDRAEDVLFLYATRPVLPWHYALGKLLAVAAPAALLMLLPGVLIAALRALVTGDLDGLGAFAMTGKVAIASLALAWGYAGATVGPSAAVKRSRWALLIALALFTLPDALAHWLWPEAPFGFGPGSAIDGLLEAFFDDGRTGGLWGALVLAVYGTAGLALTAARARREMIP